MNDDFDPYAQWLGIEPHERPIDHYRLLGLARFESNRDVIEAAADQRMAFLRSLQTGPRGGFTQKLLNELAAARVALLNPSTKAAYDDVLRGLAAAQIEMAIAAGGARANPPVPAWATPTPALSGGIPRAVPLANPMAPFAVPTRYTPVAPLAVPVAMPPPLMAAPPAPPPAPAPPPVTAPQPAVAPQFPPASPPMGVAVSPAGIASVAPTPVVDVAHAADVRPASKFGLATAPGPRIKPVELPPPVPLVARPWFPVVVAAAVVMIALSVWTIGKQFRQPAAAGTGADAQSTGEAAGESDKSAASAAAAASADSLPPDVVVGQEGNGQINFPASTARLQGSDLRLDVEGAEPAIVGWTGDEDQVRWEFRVVRPDIFQVEVTYSAAADAQGGTFALAVGDVEKQAEVVASSPAGSFRTDKLFLPVKSKGKHTLVVRSVERKGDELWKLQAIRFLPQGLKNAPSAKGPRKDNLNN